MTDLPTDLTPLILQGHVIDVLRSLPENSVQCVVTSPPYWGLRAYGTDPQVWGGDASHDHEWAPTSPRRQRSEEDVVNPNSIEAGNRGANYEAQGGEACGGCGAWRGELGLEPTPELYVAHLADVFDEVRRVLREDGTLWLNLGDTYTTHPAGLTGLKRWKASGLANRDTTGAEQAGAFDKRVENGLREKNLVGIPWRVAFELQQRGWWLRAENIWAKPSPMPESVTDRPTRAHEQVFLLTKSARYFYDADAVRRPLSPSTEERAKNHYSNPTDNPNPESKWGKNEWRSYPVIGRRFAPSTLKEIEDGYDGHATKEYAGTGAQNPSAVKARIIEGARKRAEAGGKLYANLKSVWWIATQPYPEAHFATFPEALAETCLRAGTSERGACAECGAPWARKVRVEGGTVGREWHPEKTLDLGRGGNGIPREASDGTYRRVDMGFSPACACDSPGVVPCVILDPFCGSGTVLQVARSLGLRSIGIELKTEYVALAKDRSGANLPSLERYAGEVGAK